MNERIASTPIPIWMEKLKRDKRGYPIPVNVLVDDDGRPHFTVNDESVRQRIINKDQCPICGRGLLKRRALVGGPGSAFHPHGAFIDPPMHIECARYAVQVCPYIAAPNYTRRIDDATIDYSKLKQTVTMLDPTQDPRRPEVFVLVIHTKAKHLKEGKFVRMVKPIKPYFAVEYWLHGKQLSTEDGIKVVKEVLTKDFEPDLLQALEEYHQDFVPADPVIESAEVAVKVKQVAKSLKQDV